MKKNEDFSGYKWDGLPSDLEDTQYGHWTQSFLDSIDWKALCRHASELHDGMESAIGPEFTMGGRHMVRIIDFQRDDRWIARLRIATDMENDEQSQLVQREVD